MAWPVTILKGITNVAKTGTGMALYGTGKLAMGVARHPGATIKLAGLGWGGVVFNDWAHNDKGFIDTMSDHLPDKLADKTTRPLQGAIETGEEFYQSAKETVTGLKEKTAEFTDWFSSSPSDPSSPGQAQTGNPIMDTISGIGTFFRNMFSGNGGNMFSNFLGNALGGQVGFGSTVGLLASAFLLFRGGLMGKLFGGLLAAGILGSNSILPQQRSQQQPQLAQQQSPQAQGIIPASAVQVFHHPTDDDKVLLRGTTATGQMLPDHELLKERYDVMHNNGITDIQIFNDLQQTPATYAQNHSQGMAR